MKGGSDGAKLWRQDLSSPAQQFYRSNHTRSAGEKIAIAPINSYKFSPTNLGNIRMAGAILSEAAPSLVDRPEVEAVDADGRGQFVTSPFLEKRP